MEGTPRSRMNWNDPNPAVDKMWGIVERTDKSLKSLRWSLLKGRSDPKPEAAADLGTFTPR